MPNYWQFSHFQEVLCLGACYLLSCLIDKKINKPQNESRLRKSQAALLCYHQRCHTLRSR
jgi:hypothetical protein